MAASAIPRPIVAMRLASQAHSEINTIIADHSRSDSKEEQEATNCEAVILVRKPIWGLVWYRRRGLQKKSTCGLPVPIALKTLS
jgi:hypothetical protein